MRGEDAVQSALEYALQAFDETPVVFRNIIYLTPDDEVASIEIDFLVVTRAKVFLIETKDKEGRIYFEPGSSNVVICAEKGCNEIPNPLGQNIRKIEFLKAKFPKIHFESIAVMSCMRFSIDQKVPANIMHIDDLAYHMRRKSSDYRRTFKKIGTHPSGKYIDPLNHQSVDDVAAMLFSLSEKGSNATALHVERCKTFRVAKDSSLKDESFNAVTKALTESVIRARRAGMSDLQIVEVLSTIPDFAN